MPYPPSPQYKGDSTSEDEAVQAPAAKGKYTDPTPSPSPGMNLPAWTKKKVGKKKKVLGMPLPQKDCLRPPSNCTLPCPTSWTEPYRRLWINQAPPA